MQGDYSGKDLYSYTRGMRKFAVPYPDKSGNLPIICVEEITANTDTTSAHDVDGIKAALARRDLNIIPAFLPGMYT